MEGSKIIELYEERSEKAIIETQGKYGRMILNLCSRILKNRPDSEECENDTYLGCWNSIPPQKPLSFKAYILKIARNLAIKRYEYIHADKRDIDKCIPYDELNNFISNQVDIDELLSENQIIESLNLFLRNLPDDALKVFMLRYWHFLSIKEIMAECRMSKSKVESMLFRTRKKLKEFLMERSLYEE